MLTIRYWTALAALAVFLSLLFYVLATWVSQSLWLFQISPKTSPFLCEPPAGTGGRALEMGTSLPVCRRRAPLPAPVFPRAHVAVPCRGVGGF